MLGDTEQVPQSFTDYLLIKNLYHCTPLELDEQPYETVALHVGFMNAEARAGKKRRNRAEQQAKTKRMTARQK